MLITRRVATGLLLVPLGGIRFAGAQPAPHTAQVTFVLVNDIYLMSDTLMPDGKRRGGFARLAAVVKAERARAKAAGGSVIFAHAGDTLSPSLMSSLDQGASIVTLTNHGRTRHLHARQPRIRFRQGCLSRAHGRGDAFRATARTCATPTARRCPASRTVRW